MKTKYSTLLVALCLGFLAFLHGCDQVNQSVVEKVPKWERVVVDASTPDKALKSYWKLRDAQNSNFQKFTNDSHVKKLLNEIYGSYGDIVVPLIAKQKLELLESPVETFSREIKKIVFESETKAVINAEVRNVTPIAEMAYLSVNDMAKRNNGNEYKYVLEKAGEAWKVSEVLWRSIYSGNWIKIAPESTMPQFPIETDNGY